LFISKLESFFTTRPPLFKPQRPLSRNGLHQLRQDEQSFYFWTQKINSHVCRRQHVQTAFKSIVSAGINSSLLSEFGRRL